MPRTPFTIGSPIEHPEAYAAAIEMRIKRNKWKSGRRALLALLTTSDTGEFRYWLGLEGDDFLVSAEMQERAAPAFARHWAYDDAAHANGTSFADRQAIFAAQSAANDDDALNAYYIELHRNVGAWRKQHGYAPDFLREALDKWGGLTEKQLAFARRAWAERAERAEARARAEQERRAAALPWTDGRQTFAATITATKDVETDFGVTQKAMCVTSDGRKAWLTLPIKFLRTLNGADEARGYTVTITATLRVSDDDATMAFGSRPTFTDMIAPVAAQEG